VPGETEETINETVDYLNKNIQSTHGPGASMLYILPGTRLYKELIENNKFDERTWIKTDSVYYYTQEHDIRTLNRWRKKINKSGIKLDFKFKYFWDYALPAKEENISLAILQIESLLRYNHHIKDIKKDDFTVRSTAQALQILGAITQGLKIFLASSDSILTPIVSKRSIVVS
jgi:radical SAM superfamily enzyme YgiQ (UPF0313 family)